MHLPFTSAQFFSVFAAYNAFVWPAQILHYILALLVVILLIKPEKYANQAIAGILGFYWIWMGVVYHWVFFSQINPFAKVFGVFFVLQGLLFIFAGLIKKQICFSRNSHLMTDFGWSFILLGTLIYPVLGYYLGHIYPSSPTFGLPCPTTIFTFGVLILATKLPKYLAIIPFVWSIIGFSAAVYLGAVEDISLIVVGMTSFILLLTRERFR